MLCCSPRPRAPSGAAARLGPQGACAAVATVRLGAPPHAPVGSPFTPVPGWLSSSRAAPRRPRRRPRGVVVRADKGEVSHEEQWRVAFPRRHHLPENASEKCIEQPELCNSPDDDELWQIIRQEAMVVAEEEPLLSSFLYAAILSHETFEGSLAFVLANRLSDPVLLATQLVRIIAEVLAEEPEITKAACADLRATFERDPACKDYYVALLYFKGYHAVQTHRVCHTLWTSDRQVMANAIHHRASTVYNADIHPGASLGQGLLLDHGSGTVIGETAKVGRNVSIMQGVTLGGTGERGRERRHPEIGDGVLVGAGASVMGAIKIGRGTMIAAGSLVVRDFVEPYQKVAGTPARVVGSTTQDGSSTMDQAFPNKVHKTACSEWERAVAAQASVGPALGEKGAALLREVRAMGEGGQREEALGISSEKALGIAAGTGFGNGNGKEGMGKKKKKKKKDKRSVAAAAAGGEGSAGGKGAERGGEGKGAPKGGAARVEAAELEFLKDEGDIPGGNLDSYYDI